MPATATRTAVPPARRARAALASELIKLRSLRSMPATLIAAAVFCLGLSAQVCSNYAANWHTFGAQKRAEFNPTDTNLGYLVIAVLFFGALGALAVTNEYGNGLIRATFAATPQRVVVVAAKTVLLAMLAATASAAICFPSFLAGQSLLSGTTPHATLDDPGVLGHLLGAVYYLTVAALVGVFVGVLARSTAVAVSALFGIFLVLPIMVDNLPHSVVWRHTVPYLPSNLGAALWHSHSGDLPSTPAAAILLPVYVVILGALGTVLVRRRDA